MKRRIMGVAAVAVVCLSSAPASAVTYYERPWDAMFTGCEDASSCTGGAWAPGRLVRAMMHALRSGDDDFLEGALAALADRVQARSEKGPMGLALGGGGSGSKGRGRGLGAGGLGAGGFGSSGSGIGGFEVAGSNHEGESANGAVFADLAPAANEPSEQSEDDGVTTITIATVPVPPSLLLLGTGFAGLGLVGRRRRA